MQIDNYRGITSVAKTNATSHKRRRTWISRKI